jgi:type IV secretion system protein TrbG
MIVGQLFAHSDTVFVYGQAEPVVTCAPLIACVIELEAGERVTATALGDTERWVVDEATAGRAPIVIVRPAACDLATNLVVATDRRVYELSLESPVCAKRSLVRTTRHVRFAYADSQAVGVGAVTSPPAPESLSFAYRWKPDRRAVWSPVVVYDDGAHGYVRLPESARHADLPVLLVEEDDHTTAVINYTVRNDTYVTDRVFARAILRDRNRQVEIVNTRMVVGKR